ncbi:MAG: hypothetical protein GWN66_25830, partial [Pseudomonas stutzeri]|nr:hypothetical protein [Stutzerimonas stutzeri]
MERGLIDRYREIVERGLDALTSDNYHHWVKIANVPESIRGFGHVKHASVVTAQARWNDLLSNVPGAAHPAPVEEASVTHPG